MKNSNVATKKRNITLYALFTTAVTLSVIGYILRGTAAAPADRATEGVGVIIGLISGIVFFTWFCLVAVSFLKKNR